MDEQQKQQNSLETEEEIRVKAIKVIAHMVIFSILVPSQKSFVQTYVKPLYQKAREYIGIESPKNTDVTEEQKQAIALQCVLDTCEKYGVDLLEDYSEKEKAEFLSLLSKKPENNNS